MYVTTSMFYLWSNRGYFLNSPRKSTIFYYSSIILIQQEKAFLKTQNSALRLLESASKKKKKAGYKSFLGAIPSHFSTAVWHYLESPIPVKWYGHYSNYLIVILH